MAPWVSFLFQIVRLQASNTLAKKERARVLCNNHLVVQKIFT